MTLLDDEFRVIATHVRGSASDFEPDDCQLLQAVEFGRRAALEAAS
ncbi:MAG TPA: hypothetical protein VI318_06945 [Baekduia sp.]